MVRVRKHCATEGVADGVAREHRANGVDGETLPGVACCDPRPSAGVVVGGSLYMGRWHADAVDLLQRHKYALSELPLAVFGMGPRTLETHEVERSMALLRRSLASVPEVEPVAVPIIGGAVRPTAPPFPFTPHPESRASAWQATRPRATHPRSASP